MIPPTTTGIVAGAGFAQRRPAPSGISWACEPERIDSPMTWTPSCTAEAAIWTWGQPDPLVDDIHAGVASPDR